MMDGQNQAATGRDGNGCWTAGHSGNPAGKPPGTRNRSTVMRQALREGEDLTLARAFIDQALGGDRMALRFFAERLMPKERPGAQIMELGIEDGATATPEQVFDAALARMVEGQITLEEFGLIVKGLTARSRVGVPAEPRPAFTPEQTERIARAMLGPNALSIVDAEPAAAAVAPAVAMAESPESDLKTAGTPAVPPAVAAPPESAAPAPRPANRHERRRAAALQRAAARAAVRAAPPARPASMPLTAAA